MSPEQPATIFSLPLFPLHIVLFPQFPLQLHIFEDRYKAMISECIEQDQPFGVVLIREGQETEPSAIPHDIGCLARILAVKKLEDGRMNLLAVGESRFRLLEYSEGDLPYLIGRVEILQDTSQHGAEPEKPMQELNRLFKRYLHLLTECAGISLPEIALPDDPTMLGFCIAAVTQLPAMEKQRMLAMTNAQARLKAEKRLLRQQIKELETLRSSSEEPAQEEEPVVRVLYAEPLNLASEFWQRYCREARH